MPIVEMAKEIAVKVKNEVGTGAAVFKAFSDPGINIRAFGGYSGDADSGYLLIVPEDFDTAIKVLKESDFEVKVSDIVLAELPNRPGALADAMEKLAKKKINVQNAYATAFGKKSTLAVFKVNDAKKAIKALEE